MLANRFDRAAEAPILNTYVPIDFSNLYRIGATLKEAVDLAALLFQKLLEKFGEFRSPSSIDVLNWYNLTTGRKDIQNAINLIASNPDALKDAAFRASLQSAINSTDYYSLSLLRESADNLRLGLKTRAQMEAEGRYKRSWDKSDIPNYDTLGSKKVFDDITPLRYMTANELSNAYFDNLKPSSLGSVYKDGVKYNRAGITYDTLADIANARFNDLISTPQGQKYYEEALVANGGNADAARQAFVGMIADSQRDRIVNQDTVDPAWLQMSLAKTRYGDNQNVVKPLPTRLEKLTYDIATVAQNAYGAPVSEKANKDMTRLSNAAQQFATAAETYAKRYQETENPEDYAMALRYQNRAKEAMQFAYDINRKEYMKKSFEDTSKFNLTSDPSNAKGFSRDGYLRGVKSALARVSNTVELDPNGDILLTSLGAKYNNYTTKNGSKVYVYDFGDSLGFVLPETVFSIATGTKPVGVKRRAGVFAGSDFPFKEALEGGRFNDVQFIPDSSNNITQVGNSKLISGKIRIPKDEVERILGTGTAGFLANYTLSRKRSTKESLEELYGSVSVEYGEDGSVFYEMPTYKLLPPDNVLNYWSKVNAIEQGSPSTGGLGGSTLAKEMYPYIIESGLQQK